MNDHRDAEHKYRADQQQAADHGHLQCRAQKRRDHDGRRTDAFGPDPKHDQPGAKTQQSVPGLVLQGVPHLVGGHDHGGQGTLAAARGIETHNLVPGVVVVAKLRRLHAHARKIQIPHQNPGQIDAGAGKIFIPAVALQHMSGP